MTDLAWTLGAGTDSDSRHLAFAALARALARQQRWSIGCPDALDDLASAAQREKEGGLMCNSASCKVAHMHDAWACTRRRVG